VNNKTLRAGACAASLLAFSVAACSHTAAEPGAGATAPAGHTRSPSTPAEPATVLPVRVVSGIISATCVAGVYDKTQNEFNALSGLVAGSDIAPGDVVAEAYQLSLADTSPSGAAKVAGFEVAFYAGGRRLGTQTTKLSPPSDIGAGKSVSWTEYPWATSSWGHGPSVGPFAEGNEGDVNSAATCRLVRLST
jgi:hypothetical protein